MSPAATGHAGREQHMSPEMESQSRRWLAHPLFCWVAGMRRLRDAPGYADHLHPQGRYPDGPDDGFTEGCIPDLSDPATQGLLPLCFVGFEPLSSNEVSALIDGLYACQAVTP